MRWSLVVGVKTRHENNNNKIICPCYCKFAQSQFWNTNLKTLRNLFHYSDNIYGLAYTYIIMYLLLDSIVYGWTSSWSPPLFWRDIFYDNDDDACKKVPFCNMTPLTIPALFVDAPAAIYHFAEWCIKARKIIWRKNGTDSKFALCILSRVF